ncbi:MAG: RecQ family ATP-dependent DNA helicase [Chitinophagales bacterium]|nr:RecQ family ATP-dependent DNA helicase [Chitinophagales bacterium]
MSKALEILKDVWKYDNFRFPQADIIEAHLQGHDVLALLPTGAGKSICYQVPALVREGVCIVISPLIALMKDQVQQLKRRGVNAGAIFSGISEYEIDRVLNNCAMGHTKLLYISPERLASPRFLTALKTLPVSMIAVDEAHCISQWGFDFRPSYRNIATVREYFPDVPLIALTASATLEVQKDIIQSLELKKDVKVFRASFERPNISFVVREHTSKSDRLLGILQKVNGVAIVYALNRKRTEEVAKYLSEKGMTATFYHAGLNADERSKRQDDWLRNKVRVMCCTNAFGMGIDKSNVRIVVHIDVPASLEAYYQEAGRAGRDGKRSYAVLLFNEKDKDKLYKSVEEKFPKFDFVKLVYNALYNYLNISFGGGKNHSFEFNITQFSRRYKWDALQVFNALKLLEQAGYLVLGEAFYLPSRLKFEMERTDLYRFQVANMQYDGLIKAILRTYEGVLHFITKINEFDLAKIANLHPNDCIKMLRELNEKGVLIYIPSSEKPRISFLEERIVEDKIRLDFEWINFIKSQMNKRVQGMLDYAEADSSTCRQIILRNYFGEESPERCGVCDNCLRVNQLTQVNAEELRLRILKKMTIYDEYGVSINVLVESLGNTLKDQYLEMIKVLLDEHQLKWIDESKKYISLV